MTKKKNYKGVVIYAFNTKGKQYLVGSVYSTTCKRSFDYLIKSNRIK